MQPQNPNPNPNHQSTMQSFHFLSLLAHANHPSPARRNRFIHRAAYASMACAARPKKTWSRVLLQRLRRRVRVKPLSQNKVDSNRRNQLARSSRPNWPGGRTNELRRLVPGGKRMELGSLLEEAGDYIQCLSNQVKLMQTIADSLSTAN